MRKVCPLIGQFGSLSKVEDGVRIVPANAMLAHMQCHVAYAATAGFEGMDACPLYVQGATVHEGDGAITASDEDAATAIRRRTEAHERHATVRDAPIAPSTPHDDGPHTLSNGETVCDMRWTFEPIVPSRRSRHVTVEDRPTKA